MVVPGDFLHRDYSTVTSVIATLGIANLTNAGMSLLIRRSHRARRIRCSLSHFTFWSDERASRSISAVSTLQIVAATPTVRALAGNRLFHHP
jgi:hypothetical protein